jgi:ubiquitin-protein ligase
MPRYVEQQQQPASCVLLDDEACCPAELLLVLPISTIISSSSSQTIATAAATTAITAPDVPQELKQEQSLRDYKVTIEYKHLKSHAPGGVYLIPSLHENEFRTFYGVIFVRRGPYMNGVFKFRLVLPQLYNDLNEHPQIIFTNTPVFSPFVDTATGALDIVTAYPRWDPARHYLVTVLTFLKKIFYAKSFDEAIANPYAKELARTNPTAFKTQVDDCVIHSQKSVYDGIPGFTEEKLAHRVLRELLYENIKDPNHVGKNTVLSMINKAKDV